MEEEQLKAILESLLFAAGEPVSIARLGNALESVPRDTIKAALSAMASAYVAENRGLMIEEVAGGYQLRTRKENGPYIRRLLSSKPPRLSRPLLETLAIIAYRPNITRPEIEELRGVDTGGVLETLAERGLIKIAGRKDAPGRPALYETTAGFLELFGLKTLADLPDLEEFQALNGTAPSEPLRNATVAPLPVAEETGTPPDPSPPEEEPAAQDPPSVAPESAMIQAASDTTAPAPAAESDSSSIPASHDFTGPDKADPEAQAVNPPPTSEDTNDPTSGS